MTKTEEKTLTKPPLSVELGTSDDDFGRPKRRRRICVCCGAVVAVLILVGVIFAILSATAFKPKYPRIGVNSVRLQGFDFRLDPLGAGVHLNVTIDMDLSIRNPNVATFKFGNSTTRVSYRGLTVGEAFLPSGKIKAKRTTNLTTSVTVMGDRLLSESNLLSDVLSGSLVFGTWTRVAGRVDVLNVFKHHAVSYSSCNLTVSVLRRRLESETCTDRVKL